MFLRVALALLAILLGGFAVVSVWSPRTVRAITHATFSAGAGSAASSQSSDEPAAETNFIRQLSIPANDIVFDKVGGKLYASVPSKAGPGGNSIARINPVTGAIESFVFVGSEPAKLALADDGQTLYVGLDGAASVRRYDLTTQTPGLQFSLGNGSFSGPLFAKDIAVAPGNPNVVAIARTANLDGTSNLENDAVFDNGVPRLLTVPRVNGSDFIAFSTSASTLYGVGNVPGGLEKMSIGPSGLTLVNSKMDNTFAKGDFKLDNGLMYMPFGQVYNAESATSVGTFTMASQGLALVEPDASVGRVYFLTGAPAFDDVTTRTLTLRAFDKNTFVPLGTFDVPNVTGKVNSLIRWGANGLAFGTSGGQVFLIQTTLVPSNEPVPTPTATPSPTPTPSPSPTPTPAPGDLREVSITAKDIVINPTTGTIYASVPSSVGSGGNSITPLDPISNTLGQPVFVGSEPNKLAISDDGQTIYVGLDGAHAVRRFDVASATPGLQFSAGSNQQGQFVAVDIAVAPGQPQTVALARGSNPNASDGGVAIYDDGVQRPNATGVFHTINVIEYSASPLLLYGHNSANSEFGFRRMATASCGLSMLNVSPGLLSGANNFKIEDGLAYSTWGRVADPESGSLRGTYPVTAGLPAGSLPTAVFPDAKAGRVYFFQTPSPGIFPTPQIMLVQAYDMRTFLRVGALAVSNITGTPTTVVRWGADGFALRTSADKVYLLRTSLIAPPQQPPPLPAPVPTPPSYTLRGQVGVPTVPFAPLTVRLSGGGLSQTLTTNPDGSFAFTGLPFCTDFTVSLDPVPNYSATGSVTITAQNQNNPNQTTAFFSLVPKQIGFTPGSSVSIVEGGTASLTVRRFNDASTAATVDYQTVNGTASDRSDYLSAVGTLRFAPNESTKQVTVFTTDDVHHESNETFTLVLSNPTGSFLGSQSTLVVTILDNDSTDGSTNPADDPQFFVRQHYQDFLNRDPDSAGLSFWVNEITSCGTDQQCIEIKRINVSAAFFLSIEFQQTGYLVYKANQASFNSGEQLGLGPFLADTQEIGRGIIFGQPGADAQLETNKQKFFLDFVQRLAFLAPGAYPTTLSAAQFVDKLNANTFDPLNPSAGPALTASERDGLVTQLATDPTSPALRAQVLRSVSENGVFHQRQLAKAFVLMQYFGYLRRVPNTSPDSDFTGYNFWLGKLNTFNGNFIAAEMVKAFISSAEYRARFGP